MQKSIQLITDAQIVLPNGTLFLGSLIIEGNRIRGVTQEAPASLLLSRDDVEVYSAHGGYVTPGLIDQHIHGAFGVGFCLAALSDLQKLVSQLPQFGITGLLPTLLSMPLMDMVTSGNALEEMIHLSPPGRSRMLGIHLEGPYLNPLRRGAHAEGHLLPFRWEELQLLLSPNVRLMTLAPELPGALEAIERLTAQGVLVSAGHSNATSQQMRQAAQQGVRCVTHLMNAMRPFHHRDPGIVGHALTDDALYVEVIADGVHVHPEALRLIFNAKPSDRIVLVSDGLPLIGMAEDARFEFGDQWIHRGAIGAEAPGVDTGCCGMQANGTLVGSVTPLNEIIRLGVGWGLASFAQLVSMATVNPARLLGIEALGVLAEGALADVVVWDTEFNVQATWIDGLLVYDRQAIPTTTAAV